MLVSHVPAPPPRRQPPKPKGAVGPGADNGNDPVKAWVAKSARDVSTATTLLAEATALRERTHQTAVRTGKEAAHQQQIVFDNLKKRVKHLKAVRSKLTDAQSRLQRATASLGDTRDKATTLCAKLQKPMQKCSARTKLRSKRPQPENVADAVSAAVNAQANGIAAFLQKLETDVMGANQLIDENSRHLRELAADIANKNASISVEEECLSYDTAKAAADIAQGTVAYAPSSAADDRSEWLHHAGRNTAAGTTEWKAKTAYNLEHAQQLIDQTNAHNSKVLADMLKVRATHKQLNQNASQALQQKNEVTSKQDAKLTQQIDHLEDAIDGLMKQRADIALQLQKRQEPLQVVKRRLDARRNRPGGENVRDEVEQELEKEFIVLAEGIDALQRKAQHVDEEMKAIRRAHQRLRQAMMAKQMALAIDKECYDLDDDSQYNLSTRGGSVRGSATGVSSNASNRSCRDDSAAVSLPPLPASPRSTAGVSSPRSYSSMPSPRGPF